MKAALSVILAALLIILPVEQVLAQAVQQEAVRVQQAPPSNAAARLLRVPPLTENSAPLLRTSPDGAPLSTPFADAPLAQEDPDENWFERRSLGVKILLVVVATFVAILLFSIVPRLLEAVSSPPYKNGHPSFGAGSELASQAAHGHGDAQQNCKTLDSSLAIGRKYYSPRSSVG